MESSTYKFLLRLVLIIVLLGVILAPVSFTFGKLVAFVLAIIIYSLLQRNSE